MTGNGSCIRFKKNMYIGDTLSESFPLLIGIYFDSSPNHPDLWCTAIDYLKGAYFTDKQTDYWKLLY